MTLYQEREWAIVLAYYPEVSAYILCKGCMYIMYFEKECAHCQRKVPSKVVTIRELLK